MRFGVCVMANIDEIGFFNHAESLGFDSVWVTDSQMLFSDCYAVLAMAATQTSRLSLGTGNTAMRTMGQRPMRIADYAEYLRVLSALLRGEVVDYTFYGVTRPIKILMHDKEYMNLEPKIPLYVSGFGPRAMELAGRYGDGLVFAIPPRGVPVAEALGHARKGAAGAGRAFDQFRNCALTNIALLEPGEAVDSERVIGTVGPNVMATVYYFYDEERERGVDPPPFLRPMWKQYCAHMGRRKGGGSTPRSRS